MVATVNRASRCDRLPLEREPTYKEEAFGPSSGPPYRRREKQRVALAACPPWPFDTITPERWAALPDEDKAMIEALTATFIAELARQRRVDTPTPTRKDRPYPRSPVSFLLFREHGHGEI